MKKIISFGVMTSILGICFYLYLENSEKTTFGEAFDNDFGDKTITKVIVEDR